MISFNIFFIRRILPKKVPIYGNMWDHVPRFAQVWKQIFLNKLLKEMAMDVIFIVVNWVANSFLLFPVPTCTHPKSNKCFQFVISIFTIFSHFVSFQWNDVILTFRSGMSVGRHRRYMKSYDSCFIASESIDWLHEELKNNPNFGPKVTRLDWLLWVLHEVYSWWEVLSFKKEQKYWWTQT